MSGNEELTKTIESLAESVKSIKDELQTLKRGAIQNGSNPQSSAGAQQSEASISTGADPPPGKKARMEEEDPVTDEEPDDWEDSQAPLVALSDAASAFLEATFGSKLDNKTRVAKAKGQGTPDSQWIRCAKIDQVVATNVPSAARTADRSASRLQQFWLDAVNPLVFILEKAEELELPKEVIGGIQTALQLLGNANFHHSASRRQALMLQLNPKLKQLFSDADFKDAAPYLFEENFGTLAKERLEAAEALKKATFSDKAHHRGFQKSYPQKNFGRGGGSQFSGHGGGSRGWQGSGNKAKKGQPRK